MTVAKALGNQATYLAPVRPPPPPRAAAVQVPSGPPSAQPAPFVPPPDARLAGLPDLESRWGARSFDYVPELSFEPFGTLTPQGADAIRALVQGLAVPRGAHVLFRGQKEHSATLVRLTGISERRRAQEIASYLAGAESTRRAKVADLKRYDALAAGVGVQGSHAVWMQRYETATPLDMLVHEHKSSYGHPLLVSATRSLRVAVGDYNMRTTNNDNRFVYVLAAPETQLVNVVAAERAMRQDLEAVPGARRGAIKTFGTEAEDELAVWVDATPYVVAVYDTEEERFVQPEP